MLSRLPYIILATAVLAACGSPTLAETPQQWLGENLDGIVSLYREFHQSPELSFQEKETAARLAAELKKVGAEVTTDIGGHGVVAILKNGPGPTLMLRTDLDALPVTEETQLVYASKVKVKQPDGTEVGVMHACGHDIHLANLVGVARYLASHRDQWSGTVMFLGQPAEERGAGAKAMLDDGLFKRFPQPDVAVALHVDSGLATGKVGYRAGYAMANVDSVDVIFHGRGGHGAAPHTTIDPIVMAAKFVLDVQTIVSREISPLEPAVITVGSIHGGTKHNIIADDCALQLTVRSYTDEVREKLLEGIRRKAEAAAAGSGAKPPTVKESDTYTPAVYNDPELTGKVVPHLQEVLGEENLVPAEQTMGGEDFARYGRAGVPIFMFRLGSVRQQRLDGYKRLNQPPPSLHSAVFYPDAEETLTTGVTALGNAALLLLPQKEKSK